MGTNSDYNVELSTLTVNKLLELPDKKGSFMEMYC